tara:strand:+ start:28989 stop:29582 length:594 start_codon:yes stop_codon:yes gene_type:complete
MSSFWSSDFNGSTTISDPKRKFRFTVSMTGLTDTDAASNEMWYAKTATKPSFQIATTEHKYLNHTFFYPGTVTWQDVTLTLVDPQDPDIAASFSSLMETAKYAVPSSAGGLSTMTKSSLGAAVGTVTIAQLNGDGAEIESWVLKNALITEMKFGDLEYGADDLTELSLTLKYDWAECTTSDGIGFDSTDTPGATTTP